MTGEMIPLPTARATVLEELQRAGEQLLSDFARALTEEHDLDYAQVREVFEGVADVDTTARSVMVGITMESCDPGEMPERGEIN